ncbi:MAG: dihydrofolate reductase [Bacteroidia bacterium]
MRKNRLSIIVAIANDFAIGKDNELLWHIKDDLKLFMRATSQHAVIHGRKSFESIGKPLKNRTNIIVTRDEDYSYPGCYVVHSLKEGIELADRLEQKGEVFILGGAEIYRQALPLVDRIYVSHVDAVFPAADRYFPEINFDDWEVLNYCSFPQNERNEYSFEFAIYEPH